MSCDVTIDVTLSRSLSQCVINFPILLIKKKRKEIMNMNLVREAVYDMGHDHVLLLYSPTTSFHLFPLTSLTLGTSLFLS